MKEKVVATCRSWEQTVTRPGQRDTPAIGHKIIWTPACRVLNLKGLLFQPEGLGGKVWLCGDLRENGPRRLGHLNACSPIGRTVWEGSGMYALTGGASGEAGFEVSMCLFLPSAFRSGCKLSAVPVTMALLPHQESSTSETVSLQLKAFLYKLPWPWCLITATEQ